MFSVFFNVIFPVLIILSMGVALGRFFDVHGKTLSTLSLYLLTPALVFQALVRYENLFSVETLKTLFIITLILAVIIAAVEFLGKLFKIPKTTRIALILTLTLSNTGNFGLPITEYAFGEEAFLIASIVLVIYSFYTNTLGVFISSSEKGGFKTSLKNMLSIPFFYVVVAALLLNYFKVPIPDPVFDPIQKVGLAAIPLNLIQLGINLSKIDFIKMKKYLGTVLLTAGVKLALIPFLAFFLLQWVGLSGLDFKVLLTEIAMPPAVYCSILATHYDNDAELTSAIVFVSTILSLISLSVIIFLIS